jgi:phosphatidylglycerophosphate synthase
MTIADPKFQTTSLGPLCLLGHNANLIWGMTNAERARRLAEGAAANGRRTADGHALFVDLAFAFDPLLVRIALDRPGVAITRGDILVIGHLPVDANPAALGPEIERLALGNGTKLYNEQLRKYEVPFIERLEPSSRRDIERASYFGAYKGVTDVLTKYVWPEFALVLTRIAAGIGMTPNMVTAIGGALCVLATVAFYFGHYWSGMAMAFGFMVLDTVDGKLARCTITSSKWGNVFDHGIDLIHPPFWWYAWGVGLAAENLALSSPVFWLVIGSIVAGYVLQRLIEGIFIKRYAMDIHVWRRFDSHFRLVTARRNPNMAILLLCTLFGRPDVGLIAVAIWTIVSLIVHAVQLAQASAFARRAPITSWLEAA